MFVKAVGICLIVICGGLWGISKGAAYRKKVEICDEIISMLRRTSTLIRCNCCDTEDIINELKDISPIFKTMPDIIPVTEDINTLLCGCVEKAEINDEEKRLLSGFCRELGTSDIKGQSDMLDSLTESASEIRSRRCSEYIRYGRLYRSIGILFGLMAGIVIV